MTSPEMFNVAVITPAMAISVVSTVLWVTGFCSSWFLRNVQRFNTLAWGAFLILHWRSNSGGASLTMDSIVCLIGLISWNRPKDNDGPPRRRRRKKEKTEEKRTELDWTGAAVPTRGRA